jgi:hypothetical protein
VASQTISKLCILTIIIFLFNDIKKKEISFLTHASFQHTKPFQNAIKHQNEFNQCANIHGHIHTQCTLALIQIITFHIRHFSMVCWNSTNLSPHGFFIHIHYYNRTMFSYFELIMTSNQHTYMKLKVSHECIQAFFLHW